MLCNTSKKNNPLHDMSLLNSRGRIKSLALFKMEMLFGLQLYLAVKVNMNRHTDY